jgi:hypothetical protein
MYQTISAIRPADLANILHRGNRRGNWANGPSKPLLKMDKEMVTGYSNRMTGTERKAILVENVTY